MIVWIFDLIGLILAFIPLNIRFEISFDHFIEVGSFSELERTFNLVIKGELSIDIFLLRTFDDFGLGRF